MPPTAARLSAAVARRTPARATDAALLARFAADRDEAAFAELVRRHGGLVRGAARRILGDDDADDVAQAAFLLLAKKAGGAWRPAVGPWLYAVACRLALKARAKRARRPGELAVEPPAPATADALLWADVRAALDEELSRLPADHRDPLVLCYLDGRTRDEAAAALGVTASVLKGRLERGREALRRRLARRGLDLAAVLAAILTPAALSAQQIDRIAAMATAYASTGVAPPAVAALLARSRVGAWVLAVVAAVGLAAAGNRPTSADHAAPPEPAAAAVDAYGDPLPPGAVARFGTVRFQAGMWAFRVAASPDASKFVSVGGNLTQSDHVTVYDAATGRPLRQATVPFAESQAVRWTAAGRGFLVTKASRDDYAVWEFTDEAAPPPAPFKKNEINSFGPGSFTACAVSPDGKWVAGGERAGDQGNEGQLAVWALVPGKRLREAKPALTARTGGEFLKLLYTPDGASLVGVTQTRDPDRPGRAAPGQPVPLVPGDRAQRYTIFVWDAATGKELRTFEAPAGSGKTAALSPDGRTLYVPGPDGSAAAFDLATGKKLRSFAVFPGVEGRNQFVTLLAASADGKSLVAYGYGGTVGFDAATGAERWRHADDRTHLYDLAPLGGGRLLAGGGDGRILILDAATGAFLNDPAGHKGGLTAVGVAADGKTALTSGRDSTIRTWDVATGKELKRTTVAGAKGFGGLEFSPDRRHLFGMGGLQRKGEWTWTVGVVDTATGAVAGTVPIDGGNLSGQTIYAGRPLAWLPDGSFVIASEGVVGVRYSAAGKEVARYAVPKSDKGGRSLEAVAASADGKTLVLAGRGTDDRAFRPGIGWAAAFDAATGKHGPVWETTTEFTNAAFAPDGESVILTGHARGRRTRAGEGKADLTHAVVRFDPLTGTGSTPFVAPDAAADFRATAAVAVSPTGHQFAVGESDMGRTITVYETASGQVRRRLRGHRNFIDHLAFTPDGRRLVSASNDGTGLVWDVTPPAAIGTRTAAELRAAYDRLASADADAGHKAMGELVADPGTAALLAAALKPTAAPADADIDAVVRKLDAAAFADREAAAKALDALGPLAVPRVRATVSGVSSAEVRQRLEAHLAKHDRKEVLTGVRLQQWRAVEVLQAIGTPAAVGVLAELAKGSANDPLVRAATLAVRGR